MPTADATGTLGGSLRTSVCAVAVRHPGQIQQARTRDKGFGGLCRRNLLGLRQQGMNYGYQRDRDRTATGSITPAA